MRVRPFGDGWHEIGILVIRTLFQRMDAGAYVVGVAPSRLTANDGGNSRTVGVSLCSRRRARLASKEAECASRLDYLCARALMASPGCF